MRALQGDAELLLTDEMEVRKTAEKEIEDIMDTDRSVILISHLAFQRQVPVP